MSAQTLSAGKTAHAADLIEHVSSRTAASSATALLIVLSWFNAVHSPLFDCIRAGAQAWRLRRSADVPTWAQTSVNRFDTSIAYVRT